jgi:hypothetical protein
MLFRPDYVYLKYEQLDEKLGGPENVSRAILMLSDMRWIEIPLGEDGPNQALEDAAQHYKKVTHLDQSPLSFRDRVVQRVTEIQADTAQTTKSGKVMTEGQRKLSAAMWAFREIWGSQTTCEPKAMVELLAECSGSPARAAKFMLNKINVQFEPDERIDMKLIALVKTDKKRLGQGATPRTGLASKPQVSTPAGRRAVEI